jgi:uncharacterized membrane protein (DUF485 family)
VIVTKTCGGLNENNFLGGAVDAHTRRDADSAPDAWIRGIDSAEFKALVDVKQRAIVPMMVIYIVGYMGLSILAGFGRGLLGIKVSGAVNLGFILIAGNYLMSWLIGIIYARISANRHDPLVKLVIDRAATSRRSQ